ncbi:MAG TPA: TRAP transporter substrate-binding protein [Deferrisomatales bacterium]|nr:TRAP transporter substrate-binding protein [Deferrisomatales bacterium]
MRILRNLVCVASVLAIASFAAAADKKVELRLSHWVPAQHPVQTTGMEPWAKSIEEASGGSIHITIYPAQQLGKAPDHYDMARDGIVDISHINPGYQPGRFPIIGAGELPFLISNATGGSAALQEWYQQYSAKEMSDVKVLMVHFHDPGTIHSKAAIHSPDQIKGMKVRPAHATMAQYVKLLGGASVQVSAPESREALERGVADAITFPWNSIFIFGLDNVVKYHTDMKLYGTTFALVMNKASYERLSAAQKKVLDDHCTPEWVEKFSTGWAKNEDSGRDRVAKLPDHTIVPVSAEELAAWRKAAEPLRAQWKEQVAKFGVNGDAALADLLGKLKAHDAAY